MHLFAQRGGSGEVASVGHDNAGLTLDRFYDEARQAIAVHLDCLLQQQRVVVRHLLLREPKHRLPPRTPQFAAAHHEICLTLMNPGS